jgi:hypothetical protein
MGRLQRQLGKACDTGAQQEKQRALCLIPRSGATAFRAAHDRMPVGRTNRPASPPLPHDVERCEAVFVHPTGHAANPSGKSSWSSPQQLLLGLDPTPVKFAFLLGFRTRQHAIIQRAVANIARLRAPAAGRPGGPHPLRTHRARRLGSTCECADCLANDTQNCGVEQSKHRSGSSSTRPSRAKARSSWSV